MRIGEFNQILQKATDATGTLQTGGEAIYGGQVYKIKDFRNKAKLVLLLEELQLLPPMANPDALAAIREHENNDDYWPETTVHSQIVALFTAINEKLPVIEEVANTFSPHQDETVINIKLPGDLVSFETLNNANKRLENIFKITNVSGGFKIIGFDTGSSWYQVFLDPQLYSVLIPSIQLALQAIDFRESRKGSEDLELATAAMFVGETTESSKKEIDLLKGMLKIKIEKESRTVVNQIGLPDGRTEAEATSMVVKVVTELIKEIDKGTEFHLSLNPPSYVKEEADGRPSLKIDYSALPKIEHPKNTKELDTPKNNKEPSVE